MTIQEFPELGFYALAGAPNSPRELIHEIQAAEAIGLGTGFISERWNIKEAASLSGAAGAVSDKLNVAIGVTNHGTRHPIITASWAMTMHKLTGGRFALGLGRGSDAVWDRIGVPRVTTAGLEDFAGLMRRLWRGETVSNHNGPAGSWPSLSLLGDFHEQIPLMLTAFAPNSLKLAGRAFDAVILHTYFTDETTARCVRTVRAEAERVGRDPASVKIWSCLGAIGDHLPEPVRLKKTVGRLSTYLQVYGDLLVRTNGWDPAILEQFRADPFVAHFRGPLDATATTEQLEHIATLIPDEWLQWAATGSPQDCAKTVVAQFDLGVDAVILHGASPDDLAPIVDAYREIRPN